jgi:Arc/MetJ-type ribon-helix-helix transcriptional regulator
MRAGAVSIFGVSHQGKATMAEQKQKAGRPQGVPSQVLPVRLPVDLVQRLNRYLDLAETHTGLRSNRTEALRQALVYWLDAKEKTLGSARQRPAAKKRAKA